MKYAIDVKLNIMKYTFHFYLAQLRKTFHITDILQNIFRITFCKYYQALKHLVHFAIHEFYDMRMLELTICVCYKMGWAKTCTCRYVTLSLLEIERIKSTHLKPMTELFIT